MERHKARLNAELTKARLRRGHATIEALRVRINGEDAVGKQATNRFNAGNRSESGESGAGPRQWPHPRWVRVNTIKSDLNEQLRTTFASYKVVESLKELLKRCAISAEKLIHIDKHVPNLLALPPATDLSQTHAYMNGQIVIQDKASCFPAYLLDPKCEDGDSLDACAAPGNKTTHMAAILHDEGGATAKPKIYAFERDKSRASTLLTLLQMAGVQRHVITKAGQDFMKIDPAEAPWDTIGTLLLDPSCSGSGIVGRDETLNVVLPINEASQLLQTQSKKRKRKSTGKLTPIIQDELGEIPANEHNPADQLSTRLKALSTFQLKLLLHAFRFPNARRITYSTCSIYAEENEHVVMKALASLTAQRKGWQILKREDQIAGMKAWNIRGRENACTDIVDDDSIRTGEIAEACIRCEKGTQEGTQGFFVVGFVRQLASLGPEQLVDEEWEGFSDSGSVS